jgi:urease gamma subunit
LWNEYVNSEKECLKLRDQLAAMTRQRDAARLALNELEATVKGECPSILDTDRGGSMVLFELMEAARAFSGESDGR